MKSFRSYFDADCIGRQNSVMTGKSEQCSNFDMNSDLLGIKLHYVAGIRLKTQTHEGDKVMLNSAAFEPLNTFVDMDINASFNLH